MKNASNRLLIIDDEPAIRDFVGTVGKRLGFEVKDTGDTDRFRSLVREFEPTALALDLRLPQTDGIELLRFLAEEHSNAKVVVISGADDRVLSAAKRLGTSQGLAMVGSLQKPISIEALEEVLSDTIQRAITKEDLSEAIELGQLLVYYQPKISLDGSGKGTVGGAEALLRWDHPEYGIFMPGEFIPLAESTGLIAPITEFVLRETLKQIRSWHDEGLKINAAVNMARRHGRQC